MKYIYIVLIFLTGCTSIKRITSTDFVEPPVVSQPDIIEPISASIGKTTTPILVQTNDVFFKLTLLVILICVLSALPILFTYLRARRDRRSADLDTS